METKQITPEQLEAIGKALQVVGAELEKVFEIIADAFQKAAKILHEFLNQFYLAHKRAFLYLRLIKYRIPSQIAFWIAGHIPRRLLLM